MVVNSKLIDNAYYNIKSIADQDIGSSADSEDEEVFIFKSWNKHTYAKINKHYYTEGNIYYSFRYW